MIALFVFLIVIGVALYLINTLLPAPAWIKTVINAIAALFVLIYVLNMLGFNTGLHLPRN